jgi:serine/threonine protein kinase
MGVVWLAYDEYLHREVAVKEIRPHGREIRDTDPEVRRALREARAAAKLSKHAGIVTVHDVVTDDLGLPWIVMELLHGRSLLAAMDEDGPMRVDRAARIGAQVLAALDYAHHEGVLHRDVKPGNVMLVEDQAVLTDFGIAVLDGVSVLTATGQLPGSPEYVAPERIRGEEAMPAADLWSVGVMLYGMVVGRTPFQRADVQATLGAALSMSPDPDPKVGRLAPVIDGLLRKKPAERMTARQAIDRLAEIAAMPAPAPPRGGHRLGDENTGVDLTLPNTPKNLPAPDAPTLDPTPPRVPPPPSPPPRQPRSRRGPLVAAGAFLVVVAVVVAIVMANRPQDDENTAAPTTTTTTESRIPLRPYKEPLGFEIDIPEGWGRTPSADGPVSYVSWAGRQVDPKAGELEVTVQRDTTASGVSAITYLTNLHSTLSADPDNLEYERLGLRDHGSSADLEYTRHLVTGPKYFHTQVRAMAPGDVYTLTFSLSDNDATRLRDRWQAAGPLIAEIRDSFRLVS